MYTIPFFVDLLLIGCYYTLLRRRKKVMGLSSGMNTAMFMPLFFSLFFSFMLMEQFPFNYVQNVFLSVTGSMCIGWVFGRLKDEQTLIIGIANGAVMGMMTPMLAGVVLYDRWLFYILQLLFICILISIAFEKKRRWEP
ncbi:hypothetical protein JOC77_002492 [Peribacillus deserti]|uniref:EamA domain-containing protein n=1 Tax=Peribacillus deserti TaxID=673318 RepID=A0ABS2QKS1_9BACI|nr:hypothetical protein [Peribacillus deserti]MBM7693053.1 hypothetical protein [Peribacillus deserti]